MTAVAVELRGLSKRFRDHAAVVDLSLQVHRGEFFTLLGPSGCGKTTTLRMIAGLVEPDAGEILFDGTPVTRTPPWRRNIGMVFQNYALWPHMTVFENVAFGLVERGAPRREISRRVEEALDLVGLTGAGGRLPSQLSGGQQQRVALARAVVVRPALLLLDEPLSNLDARLRVQMRAELVRLQRQLGITTVYVTHDQEEALMLSTRIAVMAQGRLVQLGTPQEVYERPADLFVADFLGGANFLPGAVRDAAGDALSVELEGLGRLRAAAARNPGVAVGARVMVCLRPEVLVLTHPGGAGTDNALVGTLRLRTYLGWLAACEVELPTGAVLRVHSATPRAAPGIAEGTPVAVHVAPEDVLLLPAPG
ncbi:MAG: ABC transporter ATP-binding protein [Armatimonadota bacterium]|nr:ABC transporter ATP-binding protein [Armatimonadota bacterium]MDR7485976.1 ABC transporter ATP-binding protein [Armatimonadota bacterium]MDR7534335.1 ABC transporter ATP-binding protein [Armatimonadota bacterium]MDR7536905.1 ABC transporter ATP-binding protein [Armatimonadota bacterium]